jgi:membrane protease YdiL (CAAX protease family)
MIEILLAMLYYLPYYIILVLIPALIMGIVLRKLGISTESIEDPTQLYNSVVITGLYFPLFEELVFRGATLLIFGFQGLVIGNIIWVMLHPTHQLREIETEEWKKTIFFLSSLLFYSLSAVFYSIIWLDGNGIVAILYHCAHNTFFTLADSIKDIKWRLPRIPKRKEEGPKFIKRKTSPVVSGEGLPFEEEETTLFVRRKAGETASPSEEPTRFVKRKGEQQ